ncbi:MAG: invasion associated locus B family protein [Alphaproteobacteria bacterium]
MKFFNKTFYLALIIIGLSVKPTMANNIEVIGTYDDWTAYTLVEDGKKVCYIASTPQKDEGNYTRRDDIFAIVTHRPSDQSFNVVSIVAGYKYKEKSQAEIRIGSNRFSLFAYDDIAWAKNASIDNSIINAMEKGVRMVVKGTSSRGTETIDTYSLMGFSNALETINKACNVK